MSGTKRTPIARRETHPHITPHAVELFGELERARRARRRDIHCTLSQYGRCSTKCPACQTWYELHNQLHVELRLKPWVWPCVPRNPYPPNSPEARAWRSNPEQQELWDQLDAARRAPALS
jgi:hypothetical protein